ncbi:MAG: glutathione S-transferase family protein [Caulobacter sp.]|nr:glutathione S-transferase family protein [Caulobacter sp.]
MSLIVHLHPLSSYCWKALIALYENGTPFEPRIIDFYDPDSAAAFRGLWPIAKMPVLEDTARGRVVPEGSIVIEYLQAFYPGPVEFVPADPEAALEVRLADRLFDLHVQDFLQRIVGDRIRPADAKDPFGLADAHARLKTSYGVIEDRMRTRTWAAGDTFSMADCAAAPALYYADKVSPIEGPATRAYLERLKDRPSFARVLKEAEPYFAMFPSEP